MKTKKDLFIPFSWEERRPVFLEKFFYIPKAYSHEESWLNWSDEALFGARGKAPVCLEVCSGNGQWIAAKAQEKPYVNWVAVEMDFARARKIWLKAARARIENLYVVCAEGASFLRYYISSGSVEEAYVNFPDPWPKRHHAKHRLVQRPFAEQLARAVRAGGTVTLATDDVPYRDQMAKVFLATPPWREMAGCDLDSIYGDSFFRDLWRLKGRPIHYLRYRNGLD